MVNEMVAKITDLCWDKCITGSIGSSMSGGESTCLTNCARRYLDLSMLTMQKFKNMHQDFIFYQCVVIHFFPFLSFFNISIANVFCWACRARFFLPSVACYPISYPISVIELDFFCNCIPRRVSWCSLLLYYLHSTCKFLDCRCLSIVSNYIDLKWLSVFFTF